MSGSTHSTNASSSIRSGFSYLRARIVEASFRRSKWIRRAMQRGVTPWPVLTKQQHQAALAQQKQMMADVQTRIPRLRVHETERFLFCTNIHQSEVPSYITALDSAYDQMCQLLDVTLQPVIWPGKCLVMAFNEVTEFIRFELTFPRHLPDPRTAFGLCHCRPDGKVIISCCQRDDDVRAFACALAHEASHAFIYRYRTPQGLPSWVNEGLAEWISHAAVPDCRSSARREEDALYWLKNLGTIGENFFMQRD